MEFKDIVTVSGMSGLYKTVAERKNGMIVASLEDNESKFVSGRLHTFTTLENISVYTSDENKALKEVLDHMKKQADTIPPEDPKANNEKLKEYFEKIVPNYDKEKVYISDIKKMVKWFHILDKKDLLGKEEKKESEKGKETVVDANNPKPAVKKKKTTQTTSVKKVTKPVTANPANRTINKGAGSKRGA